MPVRNFPASKDVAVRTNGGSWSDTPREGTGDRQHLYAGRLPKRLHRSFIDFTFDWSNIKVIQQANLVLTTSEEDNDVVAGAAARVLRVTAEWSEGSHDDWVSGDAINPSVATGKAWTGDINPAPNAQSRIDITSLVGLWAPKSVRWIDGGGQRQSGGGEGKHGIRLQARDEQDATDGFEVWSSEAPISGRRPFIEVAYTPPDSPPDVMTTITPAGTVLPGTPFTGEFSDPDSDRPEKVQIQVRKVGASDPLWDRTFPFDPLWTDDGAGLWLWSVDNPGPTVLKADIAYEWRAKGFDLKNLESAWTGWRAFTQHGTQPTVTLVPIVDQPTLVGVEFVASFTVGDDSVATSARIQLRSAASVGWDFNLWDQALVPLEAAELAAGRISRPYGGVYLAPGTYEWRVMVFDSLGRASAWSVIDTFVLSLGSEVDDDGGGAGPAPNTTGYARVRGPVRVVLRDMGADRKPGTIKAIIEDPANLGISAYVNEPGEMYFTLPATHPQAGECEPYERHYAVQQYRNGNWKDVANGILTDFDASADDIIVYGIDYLGFLAFSIDTRFPPSPEAADLNKSTDDGGSRYVNKHIDFIIADQLERAIAAEDSPLGFFHMGHIDDLTMGGLLEISIYSSFVQRLDFVRGLLDSYRQGTGIRSRLKARKDPSQADRWEWDVRADPGIDRDNLRMEYGSLVQGFRVIGFTDTFATKVHGIGREPYSTVLRYHMWPEEGAPDSEMGRWGNIAKANIWQDIIDKNDLRRRVRQMYVESNKVGKRIALGLRVHSLQPWDGFDLTDNIPLDIVRGMVDTNRYGSGYWTIWGQEWRVFPDGHDELTLVIRPKEDGKPVDPDLLPGDAGPPKEFCIGHGPPTGDMICACTSYLDIDTGTIYKCPGEPETPGMWKPNYLLFDDFDRDPPVPSCDPAFCWDDGVNDDPACFLVGQGSVAANGTTSGSLGLDLVAICASAPVPVGTHRYVIAYVASAWNLFEGANPITTITWGTPPTHSVGSLASGPGTGRPGFPGNIGDPNMGLSVVYWKDPVGDITYTVADALSKFVIGFVVIDRVNTFVDGGGFSHNGDAPSVAATPAVNPGMYLLAHAVRQYGPGPISVFDTSAIVGAPPPPGYGRIMSLSTPTLNLTLEVHGSLRAGGTGASNPPNMGTLGFMQVGWHSGLYLP